jgi:hypothetical protein
MATVDADYGGGSGAIAKDYPGSFAVTGELVALYAG